MNLICIFLRLLLLILKFQGDNAVTKPQFVGTVVFTSVNSSCNASYGNVSLAISNNKLNLYMYNRYPIWNSSFDMDIKVKMADVTEYKSYFKRSVDYCKFSSNPLSDPFFNIIYEGLRGGQNNKIFGKCPIIPVSFSYVSYAIILIFLLCICNAWS